ncbi:MAG: hypothetical protein ACTH79_11480, partial [Glutamicibacter arilaitensis]
MRPRRYRAFRAHRRGTRGRAELEQRSIRCPG